MENKDSRIIINHIKIRSLYDIMTFHLMDELCTVLLVQSVETSALRLN